uniref:Uncharacterized protein n=1 Tax=Trichogramma kaykai TaxID=54128 RepID=A0ABD2WAB2_9HYME
MRATQQLSRARVTLASIVFRDASLIGRVNMAAALAIYVAMSSARVPTQRGTRTLISTMRYVLGRGRFALMLPARMSKYTHAPILCLLRIAAAILVSQAQTHTITRSRPSSRVDQ